MDGQSPEVVRADFDRLAGLIEDPDAIDRWAELVIPQVPDGCDVLEVGCGTGALARRLAARARRVLAIDMSPRMVEVARRCSAGLDNLEVREADLMAWEAPGTFDAVVSIAALHHLPFEAALSRLAAPVRPGGRLLIVDMFNAHWLRRLPFYVLSAAVQRLLLRRPRPSPALTAAWHAHFAHDDMLPLGEIRARAARVLDGARVHRHRGWHYSLSWHRGR